MTSGGDTGPADGADHGRPAAGRGHRRGGRRRSGAAPAGPVAPAGSWYEQVLDASPDGLVLVREGTIAFVNPALERMTGWPREHLVGRALETLVPERSAGRHEELRRGYEAAPRARLIGEGLLLEMRRSDGTGLPVEIALTPVDLDGRSMTLATVRDVSARRRVEAERRQLAHILDLVPDSVIVVGRTDGRVLAVNAAATRLLGHSRAELVGMASSRLTRVGDTSPPAPAEGVGSPSREPLLADGAHLRSVLLRARDGTVLRCEVHASLVDVDGGGPAVVNVVRDVGERLDLETRLRQSEESFRTAFEQAPVGIAVVRLHEDGARRFVRANAAFARMFGYPAGALVGLEPAVLRPTESEGSTSPPARLAVSGDLLDETVVRRYVRRDGTALWAEVRSTSLDLPATEGRHFLVHAVEVTSRVEAQRSARLHALVTQVIAEVAKAALERPSEKRVLELIADGAGEVLGADAVAVLLEDPTADGVDAWGAVVGALSDELTAAVEAAGGPHLVTRAAPDDALAFDVLPGCPRRYARRVGPVLMAPFGDVASSAVLGGIVAVRAPGRPGFSPEDAQRLGRLAAQTQVAVHFSRARAAQQRLALLEERQRIARELHDTVIQDVIAVGMALSADVDGETDPHRQARHLEMVTQLEAVTRNLRRAVFELRSTSGAGSLSSRVARIVDESARVLGFFPTVTFNGPVDSVAGALAEDLEAALREALANVARHADATRCAVSLRVAANRVALTVDDDGVGLGGAAGAGYGLGYLEDRARRHGGHLVVGAGPVVGTRLVWTCPLGGSHSSA